MDWSERQLLDTLRAIEESDYDEVKLEAAGFKLHVRKSGRPAMLSDTRQAPAEAPSAVAPAVPSTPAAPAVPPARVDPVGHAPEAVPTGLVAVRAPMLGTFYRRPAPHLPPFVEVGATVCADDAVCLIEVMKLFNTVKAGVAGKVVSIRADNAASVRKDEVLMLIEPAA